MICHGSLIAYRACGVKNALFENTNEMVRELLLIFFFSLLSSIAFKFRRNAKDYTKNKFILASSIKTCILVITCSCKKQ